MPTRGGGPAAERQLEIERFFAYEAWLLDERRLDEWLDLFADDALYSVAVRDTIRERSERLATAHAAPPIFVDDKQFLSTRIRRLDTRLAHAEQPPSVTRHLITNVLVHHERVGEVDASTNFVVFQTRIDISEHVFFGKRDDTLRQESGRWRIVRRQVVLDRAPLPGVLSIFL